MNPGFVVAVEMLPMPKAARLSEAQLGGRHCPWCAGPPKVSLGARLSVAGGGLLRWKPRACEECTQKEAGRVYNLHIRTCARCTPLVRCADARALHALSKGASATGPTEFVAG
ncbi:hypothetical protein [Streptomyces canus]|uniref:hypothetical protein n=1 Tax=Streptomyces canus TaxID=58343 RepID=UPI00386385F6|nr:hypothetical protein OH824_14355 [Streptomyces canus]